jgi:hypothetical protein
VLQRQTLVVWRRNRSPYGIAARPGAARSRAGACRTRLQPRRVGMSPIRTALGILWSECPLEAGQNARGDRPAPGAAGLPAGRATAASRCCGGARDQPHDKLRDRVEAPATQMTESRLAGRAALGRAGQATAARRNASRT